MKKAMALWREEAEHAAGSDDIPAFINMTREKKPSLLMFIDPASAFSHILSGSHIIPAQSSPNTRTVASKSQSVRWMKRLGYVTAFIFPTLGLVYYVYQEQVPISGRWRFNFLPKSTSQSTSSDWTPLLEELEILSIQILPKDHPATIFANAMLQRLLPVPGLEHLDWEVQVVDDLGEPVIPPNPVSRI
jgi:hypothetical protein